VPSILFVNGGILGLKSFHQFLADFLPRQSAIDGTQILLTDQLTPLDRAIRRVLCQRLWPDGLFGLKNVDLARFRQELHAGILARRRMRAAGVTLFDAIHFHRQATAYGSLDLMRRIPSIVSIDCTQECAAQDATSALERASYAANTRMDGAVFRRAAAVIATSHWAADSLRRRHPDCPAPVHVLPNPVLLDHFDAKWAGRRRARGRAGGMPRLLFVGGDFPRKGGFELLEVWRTGAFQERAVLEIVTDWDIPLPLPPGVVLSRGVQPHSAEWRARWEAADAFVMPTRNEAFGLVYQEAAAAGLPAIGTRHNAVPEIVIDGETGILVPIGDRPALAAAMHALIDSAELRDRMGSRARERLEAVASPGHYLERLTAIIAKATEGRST
jgi:starch synthase